jgi:hypothetical protein
MCPVSWGKTEGGKKAFQDAVLSNADSLPQRKEATDPFLLHLSGFALGSDKR